MAFVSAGTLTTGSTTVQPAAPASMVAGNILIAVLGGNQGSALGNFTQSGGSTTWTPVDEEVSLTPFARCEIWYTICASSSDTMPTWANNSTLFAGIIAQFSGTVTLDQKGVAQGTTSPHTVTASGTDGGTGRLIIYARFVRATTAAVNTTWTDNINGAGVGTGVNVLADQSTSAVGHLHAGYTTGSTTGSTADSDVATWTMTTTAAALAIASFSSVTTWAVAASATLAVVGSAATTLARPVAAAATLAVVGSAATTLARPVAAAATLAVSCLAGSGTATRVQAFANFGTTSAVATSGSPVTSGNILFVFSGSYTGSSAISDSLSLSWTRLSPTGGVDSSYGVWWAPITSTSTIVVTATGTTHTVVSCLEVTGQGATPIDYFVRAYGSGTAASSGASGTPAAANDLVVGFLSTTSTSGDSTAS